MLSTQHSGITEPSSSYSKLSLNVASAAAPQRVVKNTESLNALASSQPSHTACTKTAYVVCGLRPSSVTGFVVAVREITVLVTVLTNATL